MASLSKYDIKYLQSMIVHHQAALDMGRKYLSATPPDQMDARVVNLAKSIISAQKLEIDKMIGWLPNGRPSQMSM